MCQPGCLPISIGQKLHSVSGAAVTAMGTMSTMKPESEVVAWNEKDPTPTQPQFCKGAANFHARTFARQDMTPGKTTGGYLGHLRMIWKCWGPNFRLS